MPHALSFHGISQRHFQCIFGLTLWFYQKCLVSDQIYIDDLVGLSGNKGHQLGVYATAGASSECVASTPSPILHVVVLQRDYILHVQRDLRNKETSRFALVCDSVISPFSSTFEDFEDFHFFPSKQASSHSCSCNDWGRWSNHSTSVNICLRVLARRNSKVVKERYCCHND